MAYSDGEYLVNVRGTLATAEQWSNTWCFGTAGTPDLTALANCLHDFYDTIATSLWTTIVTSPSASWRRLDGGGNGDLDWANITGSIATDLIPTEVAWRLSMTDVNNKKGGPFLAGFGVNTLGPDGGLDDAALDVITGALDQLHDDLVLEDWLLSLNSPTTETTAIVEKVRVGRIGDAIRRRRNDLPEEYRTVDFTP